MDSVIGNIIQTFAVLAAVGAAIVALIVSALDRKNARQIAAADRDEARRTARAQHQISLLTVERDLALRLTENRAHGGSSDSVVRARLGAEALALVGILGRGRVPGQWDRQIEYDDEGLQRQFDKPDTDQWMLDKIEAQRAVNAINREISEKIAEI